MAVTRARAVTGRSRGKNAHELPGVRPRSLLDAQLAHKIALANGHSLPAQNVVGRRRMKVEIRLREGQEKILGREVETAVAGDEAHIAADDGGDPDMRFVSGDRRHDFTDE